MADLTFRTKVEDSPPDSIQATEATQPKEADTSGSTTQELDLFATYQQEAGHPYTADYFDLTDTWDKDNSLEQDLSLIEAHIRHKVSEDALANNVDAAQKYLKQLEKKAEVDPVMDSTNKRIEKVKAYIAFREFIDA